MKNILAEEISILTIFHVLLPEDRSIDLYYPHPVTIRPYKTEYELHYLLQGLKFLIRNLIIPGNMYLKMNHKQSHRLQYITLMPTFRFPFQVKISLKYTAIFNRRYLQGFIYTFSQYLLSIQIGVKKMSTKYQKDHIELLDRHQNLIQR